MTPIPDCRSHSESTLQTPTVLQTQNYLMLISSPDTETLSLFYLYLDLIHSDLDCQSKPLTYAKVLMLLICELIASSWWKSKD